MEGGNEGERKRETEKERKREREKERKREREKERERERGRKKKERGEKIGVQTINSIIIPNILALWIVFIVVEFI